MLVLWGVLEWHGLRAAREPNGRHLVTWYGEPFAGQVMANGALYDPNDVTVIATPYRRNRIVLCVPAACFVHT